MTHSQAHDARKIGKKVDALKTKSLRISSYSREEGKKAYSGSRELKADEARPDPLLIGNFVLTKRRERTKTRVAYLEKQVNELTLKLNQQHTVGPSSEQFPGPELMNS
jgi:hypothetical protein